MPRTGAGGSGNSKPMRDIPLRPGAAARKVAIEKVVENPRNLREDDLWENEQERMETISSMQNTGQIQALVVCTREAFLAEYADCSEKIRNADYVVIAGHRRLAAARLAGLGEVRIDVRDDMVPNLDVVMLEENLKRKALTAFQEGEGYRRLAAKGQSHAKIAALVGKGKSTITKRIALLELPENAKQAVLDKQISVDSAYNLLVALDGDNLEKLVEAAVIMKSDRITASEAVNRLFSIGSVRTDSTDGGGTSETSSANGQVTDPAAADGGESVLTEPATGGVATATQTATVPPARTETVLTEPGGDGKDEAGGEENPAGEPTKETPPSRVESPAVTAEKTGRAQANAARNTQCERLVAEYEEPTVAPQSVRVAAQALSSATSAAIKRAHTWIKAANVADADAFEATSYRDAVLVRADATLISRLAYAVALAEDEIRASNRSRNWDYRDIAHLRHLIDAGYEPTEWERRHLG